MNAEAAAFADTDRLREISVDEAAAPPPEVDQERRVAIFDLVEANRFRLAGAVGPYRLTIARLGESAAGYMFHVEPADGAAREVRVEDPALADASGEYLALCASYRDAVRTLPPSQIASADAERRAAHDEASELLRRALAPEIDMDAATARRLFTLCCALEAAVERLL